MKLSYIASQTIGFPNTNCFKSWGRVVNSLEKAHYNHYEIEAIARNSRLLIAASHPFSTKSAPFTTLLKYLTKFGYTHNSVKMNKMVMKAFGKKDKLEYDENGRVCHRGTMPGNYHPNKTILVPVGTPLSCDPTSETYWSM